MKLCGSDWIGSDDFIYYYYNIVNTTTPVQYWQEQSSDYLVLSTVARRFFAISASSALSERDFSSVGRTVTDAIKVSAFCL